MKLFARASISFSDRGSKFDLSLSIEFAEKMAWDLVICSSCEAKWTRSLAEQDKCVAYFRDCSLSEAAWTQTNQRCKAWFVSCRHGCAYYAFHVANYTLQDMRRSWRSCFQNVPSSPCVSSSFLKTFTLRFIFGLKMGHLKRTRTTEYIPVNYSSKTLSPPRFPALPRAGYL